MCAKNIGNIEISMALGGNIVILSYSMKLESNLIFTMKIIIIYFIIEYVLLMP